MKSKLIVIIGTLVVGIAGRAQQASPTPVVLPNPIMVRAPDFSSWLITKTAAPNTTDTASATKSGEYVTRKILMIKTGKIRHELSLDRSGHRAEMWCDGATEIVTSPEWKQPMISTGGLLDGSYVDFSKTDFPGFEWIAQSNYVFDAEMLGKKCWVFTQAESTISDESKALLEKSGDYDAKKYQMQVGAYIDQATQLPVMLAYGQDKIEYTFQAPPTKMLSLPDSLKRVLANLSQMKGALQQAPPRPF